MVARTQPVAIAPKPVQETDDTKWLALAIRRGLLVIVKAIEVKYGIDDKRAL